jgi:hypothetical protein
MIEYKKCPKRVRAPLQLYIEEGISCGGFLMEVLANNLAGSVIRADDKNLRLLPEIVSWLHWEAPSECYGSVKKVKAWKGTN